MEVIERQAGLFRGRVGKERVGKVDTEMRADHPPSLRLRGLAPRLKVWPPAHDKDCTPRKAVVLAVTVKLPPPANRRGAMLSVGRHREERSPVAVWNQGEVLARSLRVVGPNGVQKSSAFDIFFS